MRIDTCMHLCSPDTTAYRPCGPKVEYFADGGPTEGTDASPAHLARLMATHGVGRAQNFCNGWYGWDNTLAIDLLNGAPHTPSATRPSHHLARVPRSPCTVVSGLAMMITAEFQLCVHTIKCEWPVTVQAAGAGSPAGCCSTQPTRLPHKSSQSWSGSEPLDCGSSPLSLGQRWMTQQSRVYGERRRRPAFQWM